MGGPLTDTIMAGAVKCLVLGSDTLHEFAEEVAQASFDRSCGMDHHLAETMTNTHVGAWFTVQGLSSVVRTHLGAKAGYPWADHFFNLLVVRVHRQIELRLKTKTPIVHLPPLRAHFREFDRSPCPDEPLELMDNTYAEDSAYFVSHVDPRTTLCKLTDLTNEVVSTYRVRN